MRTIDLRTDDELVGAAAGGNRTAFEELYRRHCDAAWGVAMSVTRDRNDAADAVSDAFTRLFTAVESGRLTGVPFRPYLLTATRNASIDILRRTSRVDVTDAIDDTRLPRTTEVVTPSDAVLLGAESALVAQAFADLPERWRSVLWLTEVEGMAPREAAEVLGLSANGAAQLAVRARAGLRERYLQAHVGAAASEPCRFTIDRLGAYVGGGLSARDIAKVDQHLAGCDECRARKEELEDVGSTLRRAIIPIPLFLGAAVLGRLKLMPASAVSAATAVPPPLPSTLRSATSTASRDGVTKALAGACAGLLALGVVGVGLRTGDDGTRTRTPAAASGDGRTEVRGFTVTRPPEAVAFVAPADAPPLPSFDDLGAFTAPDAAAGDAPAAPAPVADAGVTAPAVGDAVAIDSGTPASTGGSNGTAPAPDPTPIAQATANLGGTEGLTAAVGVGDGSCSGVGAAGDAPECAAPEPDATEQVSVAVEVQGAPPVTLAL